MSKRTYSRRSDDEIIESLESKIRALEERKESKKRQDSPVIKELPKVKRRLSDFAQLCVDHERQDLANTVLGFLATLDIQSRSTS